MRILAIDTALDACSAAVLDGDRVLASVTEDIGRGHAEILMAVLARALGEAGLAVRDLDRLAVTVGPGSFTGIRVGLAAARGMALAAGLPLIGVTTLEALAAEAFAAGHLGPVLAAIDARRGEVYCALFDPPEAGDTGSRPRGEAEALTIAHAAEQARAAGASLVGSGAPLLGSEPGPPLAVLAGTRFPDPVTVARLAAGRPVPPVPPVPAYLRAADAKPQEGFRIARAPAPAPEPSAEARP